MMFTINQWLLTLFVVLSPTISIYAVIEPFVIGKMRFLYSISAQTDQAERDIMNHTSRVNQTTKSRGLTHRAPGARSNPG